MGMKGISPVIASVILIGIAIAVGVMLSSWITHWVSSRTHETSSACVTSTNYKIDDAIFNENAKTLTLKITNLGGTDIYDFTIQIINGTNIETYNYTNQKLSISPNISKNNPLRQQRTAIIIIDISDSIDLVKTAESIKVINEACPAFSAETFEIRKE
ncbi:MAG: archaellin/type IV pilin N-terminal domain-containing protein [Candidatus Aenigmatarchaeota archaeon]